MSTAAGLAWAREQLRLERERQNYRRPHPDSRLDALGIVEGSGPEKDGAADALIYMRSRGLGGPLPPQINFLFVRGLEYINGATAKAWVPGPAFVLLRAGRTYSEVFKTCCHELQHIRDRSRAFSDEERERRAESVADLAVKEMGVRWR
jgi:hypothetical protein